MSYISKKKVKTLKWMTSGAEVNVVKNLWSYLQEKVLAREPKNLYDLKKITKEEWEMIDINLIRNLTESFPKRLAMMVQSKGGHIKY